MQGSSTITNCNAGKGGGVHVSGGTFKMQDSAIVTPSTGSEQYTAGKNDVYLTSGQAITVDDILSNNPAARITPQSYTENTPVLKGAITTSSPQNRKKFTVPPQKVTENSENWNVFWYVAATGTLKAEAEDLQTLKEAVQAAPADNTPFVIKLAGTISIREIVQIPNGKKITLKADASKPAILECSHNWQIYTYFDVQSGAALTLEGLITLQGTDYGSNSQYALYVEYEGKAEIKNGVTITGFKNADRGAVIADGTLTMSGGEISGNKAKNGGGVYIAPNRNFTMTGGSIKGNTAGNGGGVYVDADGYYGMYGTFTMIGGRIEGNTADKGGGVFTYGSFTMSGGTITKNKANTDGKAVMIEHYSTWSGGEIKDNIGTCSVFGPHKSHYLTDTSGNTAS